MSLTEEFPKCVCGMTMYQFAEGFFKCRHCDNADCPYRTNPSKCERCKTFEEVMTEKVKLWYVRT